MSCCPQSTFSSLKLAGRSLSLMAPLSSKRPREKQAQMSWLLGLGSTTLGLSVPIGTRKELTSMQSKEPLRTD